MIARTDLDAFHKHVRTVRVELFVAHGAVMGSADDKPRKPRRPLAKVPKYEEPNELSLPGLTGDVGFGRRYGRFGHGSDHQRTHKPGRVGSFILRLLGMRAKDPEKATKHSEP